MFLHAVSLADITNADGSQILEDSWLGRHPTGRCNFNWPKSPPSNSLHWTEWQSALSMTFGADRFRRINSTLGTWINPKDLDLWYFSPKSNRLIKKVSTGLWRSHGIKPKKRGLPQFEAHSTDEGSAKWLLDHGKLHIADVSITTTTIRLLTYSPQHSDTILPLLPTKKKTLNTDDLK